MKTLGKIIICIIVVLLAVGVSYLIYSNEEKNINNTSGNVSNTTQTNTNNELNNNTTNGTAENPDYIGEEEKVEVTEDNKEEQDEKNENMENNNSDEKVQTELTGKDKAIDIVKKEYAVEGQTVRFDHMEGTDYVIKINDGTAVTWYLVNGTTWEAEEY